MRRVIVHGKKFERGPLKCPECECEFMYSDEDIYQERISNFKDGEGWEIYNEIAVRCPECDYIIEIKGVIK